MKIGIIALQGAFELHKEIFKRIDKQIEITEVRLPHEIKGLDGIVLPGGESTVISKLLDSSGLSEAIINEIDNNMGVFATCAGLIVLTDHLKVLDIDVERNAYGHQLASFQGAVDFLPNNSRVRCAFIRAPKITRIGSSVDAIAHYDGETVGIKYNKIVALSCHPEVEESLDFHRFFVDEILGRVTS